MNYRDGIKRMTRPERLRKAAPALAFLSAALLAVALVHFGYTADVIASNKTLRKQIDSQRDLIGKYRQKIESAGNVDEKLERLRRESGLADYLSDDIGETTITSEIDGMFSELGDKGLEMVTFQPLSQSRYNEFREVNIKAVFRGDIRGLQHLFETLNQYHRPLRIKQCTVKATSRRGNAPPLSILITLSTISGLVQDG